MEVAIPIELLEQVKKYCKENNLGMGSAWGEGFAIIMIGPRTSSPNVIALSCAQSLIEGVLNEAWNTSNVLTEEPPEVKIVSPEPDRTQ